MFKLSKLQNAQLNLLQASKGIKIVPLAALVDEESRLANGDATVLSEWLKKHGVLLTADTSLDKEALYYYDKNRQYRPSKHEIEKRQFLCPSCKVVLIRKPYKMKTRLFTCPQCQWAIRRDDIWSPQPKQEPVVRQPGEA